MTLPRPVVRELLRPYYRVTFHHRMPWGAQRALLQAAARVQALPAGTRVRPLRLGDRSADQVTCGVAEGPEAVLYLHGGGFATGSPATHRSLAAHLSRATQRPVYLLDYRLAPEYPCPAALEDTLAALGALRRGQGHQSIALAGDSAGGGIALAAAQRLAADGAAPSALALISPWTNPGVLAERRRDLVVSRAWGLACAAAYLGDGDPLDYRYAPALGPLAGLPPTYLHTNTRELLYSQCRLLAASLRDAGVSLEYAESSTLWHAAQAQASLVREAADSLGDIGRFLTAVWQASAELSR